MNKPQSVTHTPTSGLRQRYSLDIAGLRLAWEVSEPDVLMILDAAATPFLTADTSEAEVSVSASRADLGNIAVSGALLFDSGALWRLYRDGDGYLFTFTASIFGDIPYKIARFAPDFSTGQVLLHAPYFPAGQPLNPLEYPLDELILLNLLALGHGAELHSCGLVDADGAGYLFLGQSTAGKTTTARLWLANPGVSILSDDRIVVRRMDGAFIMYGTPWHGEGEFSRQQSCPLKHIFFLEKGPCAEFFPITPVEAAARLFACSFPTFHNPDGLAFTLGFYDELVQHVPCSILSFRPDQTAVEAVRRLA